MIIKLLSIIFSVILITLSTLTFGQLENNNWFFGYNNGLNFSTFPPSNTPGSLSTFEGCASISDNTGNLLFYTDGKSVYNKNHVYMTNGNNSLLGNSTATSSAVIIPKPCSQVEFYIFTVDFIFGSNGLNYSVVNMDDNADGLIQPSELGQVELSSINVNLPGPTGEKICAVKKSNGIDFWVVAIKSGTNNFYVYEITSNGVNTTPNIQSIGPSVLSSNTNGYMKFSPDGTKLVRADYNPNTKVTLFNFDNTTGQLSAPVSLTSSLNNIGWGDGFYGVEFSPNSEKVYFSSMSISSGVGNGYIYEATISPSFSGSNLVATVPNMGGGYAVGALQLTSETPQRILIAKDGEQSLASITNPNIGIIANPANFSNSAVPLNNTCALGLPTFISGAINPNYTIEISGQTDYCFGETITLSAPNVIGGNFQWLGPNGFNSNQQNISVTNPSLLDAGLYTLIISNSTCQNATTSEIITIYPSPSIDLGLDTIICPNQTITFNLPNFTSYNWNFPIVNGSPFSPPLGNNIVTLEVTDNNGCQAIDSINILVTNMSIGSINAGNNQTICIGDSIFLNAEMAGNNLTGYWSNSYQDSSFFSPIQTTTLFFTASNSLGCEISDSILISVNPLPSIIVNSVNYYCVGDSAILNATTLNVLDNITWSSNVQNNIPFDPNTQTTSTFIVSATSSFGCTDSSLVSLEPAVPISTDFSVTSDGTCAPVIITIENDAIENVDYLWDFNDGNVLLNNEELFEHTYLSSGLFEISVQATDTITGCVTTQTDSSILIINGISPNADFTMSPSQLNSLNTTIQFTNLSTNGMEFIWLFGDTQTSVLMNPVHDYLNPTLNYVIGLVVINGNGCVDTIYKTLYYVEDIVYFVPNTFTPDGNEFNNIFTPIFPPGVIPNEFLFVIYNRWGERIFESKDSSIGWDGTYGKVGYVQNGTYTWIIEFKAQNTTKKISNTGHVNILR